eukprot:gnl/MRDRNA2_/MRDRNA2_65764_c0_seq2.p1 gnl/MRDRNA2_/MRDRNA2_65764_c0~~gnl/MRDRNA2_/MRDRNA2_65764_c0_seq2.p1  ORF type:complete len:196 (+),score=27.30 gnl/MRDRNA2_/MRDRNA2_65764_c0_seq2:107-694(+)
MCQMWSGGIQNLKELDAYEFYMRMDDDSLWDADVNFDPFKRMKEKNLSYAYRTMFVDPRGTVGLWESTKKHFERIKKAVPFSNLRYFKCLSGKGLYNGAAPYNNFHVSRTSFWRSSEWNHYLQTLEEDHVFMQECAGDANVHVMAMGAFMEKGTTEIWKKMPVKHNNNDLPGYPPKSWGPDCRTFSRKDQQPSSR